MPRAHSSTVSTERSKLTHSAFQNLTILLGGFTGSETYTGRPVLKPCWCLIDASCLFSTGFLEVWLVKVVKNP